MISWAPMNLLLVPEQSFVTYLTPSPTLFQHKMNIYWAIIVLYQYANYNGWRSISRVQGPKKMTLLLRSAEIKTLDLPNATMKK